jgi:4-amino-4-deoxy-L-arabinose transferase-like glycosyltransferase
MRRPKLLIFCYAVIGALGLQAGIAHHDYFLLFFASLSLLGGLSIAFEQDKEA